MIKKLISYLMALYLTGCAHFQYYQPKIEVVSFKEFNPAPFEKKINPEEIPDPITRTFLTEGVREAEKKLFPGLLDYDENIKVGKACVKDRKGFQEIILQEVAKLGLDPNKIKKLSIRDALVLIADIVSKRVEYDSEAVGDTGIDKRLALDQLCADQLFLGKKGVCRHYGVKKWFISR